MLQGLPLEQLKSALRSCKPCIYKLAPDEFSKAIEAAQATAKWTRRDRSPAGCREPVACGGVDGWSSSSSSRSSSAARVSPARQQTLRRRSRGVGLLLVVAGITWAVQMITVMQVSIQRDWPAAVVIGGANFVGISVS